VPHTLDPPFRVEPGPEDRAFVLTGELDMAATDQVGEAVASIEGSGDVVFDLRALTFIDSSGIRALLQAAERIDEGKLILAHPTEAVQRVLDLVGMRDASPKVVIQT
jgi:anti-sigma B factor antagonist